MKPELIEIVKQKCIGFDVVVELYEEPIDFSEYDPQHSILQLCTVSVDGIPDEAVVYHELAHVEQHHSKYWALMLILWMEKWIGLYPSFLHYLVERDATERAIKVLNLEFSVSFSESKIYLYKQLIKYRKGYIWNI